VQGTPCTLPLRVDRQGDGENGEIGVVGHPSAALEAKARFLPGTKKPYDPYGAGVKRSGRIFPDHAPRRETARQAGSRNRAMKAVWLAPAMLDLSRRLNPECEHVAGDMRSIMLGRVFDGVRAHDAVSYMASRADLARAVATAFAHTEPGGVTLFQPDFVGGTFTPGYRDGGGDADGRGLRYLEWRRVPASNGETYVTDMTYLLRNEGGAVRVVDDRHVMGLFSGAVWMEQIAAAGFAPLAVPFEHSSYGNAGQVVFLGLRRACGEGA
jgi:hypothetical protein